MDMYNEGHQSGVDHGYGCANYSENVSGQTVVDGEQAANESGDLRMSDRGFRAGFVAGWDEGVQRYTDGLHGDGSPMDLDS